MAADSGATLDSARYWESLVKKSVSRYLLLDMLARRPMHGYEIAKSIESCCEGWCKPTDGMIYPAIAELVDGGYVECVSETGGRRRKVCHLTDKGRRAHRTAAAVWASVLPYIGESVADALSTDRGPIGGPTGAGGVLAAAADGPTARAG